MPAPLKVPDTAQAPFRDLITLIFPLWRSRPLAALPQRHSREGGNPFIKLEQALIWVPAFAETTLRRNCPQEVLLSGNIPVIKFRDDGRCRTLAR